MGCCSSANTLRENTCLEAPDFYDKYMLGVKLYGDSNEQVRFASMKDPPSTRGLTSKLELKSVKIMDMVVDATKAQHEVNMWMLAGHHPNCVRLYDVFYGKSLCFAVTERCNSCLIEHLEHMSMITEQTLGEHFIQMLSGISHLHAMNIVHRDVKAESFLIGDDDTVKLSDFGVAAVLPTDDKLEGLVGTMPYACPEMLASGLCDTKADVWSFGVLVYALLFGCFPYTPTIMDTAGMKTAITQGALPSFKPHAPLDENGAGHSQSVVDFARSLLARSPQERPSADEASHMVYLDAIRSQCHSKDVALPSLKPLFRPSFRKLMRWRMETDLHIQFGAKKLLYLQTEKHMDGSISPSLVT